MFTPRFGRYVLVPVLTLCVLGAFMAAGWNTPVGAQGYTLARLFGTTTTGTPIPLAASTAGVLQVTVNATGSQVTAGSGTGVTVVNAGEFRETVYKVTVTSAQFIAAAVTADVTLATLPAKTVITGVVADLTQQFACASVCTTGTLSMTVGTAAGGTQLLASFDADAAAAQFGDADAEMGTALTRAAAIQAGAFGTWGSTTPVSLRLTSGTGNIGTGSATNLSQGSVTFYLVTRVYP